MKTEQAQVTEVVEVMQSESDEQVEVVEDTRTTQEIIESVEQSTFDLQAYMTERAEMAKELEALKQQAEINARNALELNLKQDGLEMFTDLFYETDRIKQVEMFRKGINEFLLTKSYVPAEQARQEQYDVAIQKGDVKGAIASKFSKLLGK